MIIYPMLVVVSELHHAPMEKDGRVWGESVLEVSGEVVELVAIQLEVLFHPGHIGIAL